MVDVPFVVEIAPWFAAGDALKHDAAQRPDVHGPGPTWSVTLDDLRRHVHRGARQTVHQVRHIGDRARGTWREGHYGTLVLSENLGSTKVGEFDHSSRVQEYIWKKGISIIGKQCTCNSLSGLISRWWTPCE